jgi:Flp pilus assembly protein TadG
MNRVFGRIWRSRLLGAQGGASTVEFAIAVPAFLLLLVGMTEVARGCWTVNALHNAVAHTARYAQLSSSSKPTATGCDDEVDDYRTNVRDYLEAELDAVLPTALPVVTLPTCPTGGLPTLTVTISATYTYQFLISAVMPLSPITVQQRATVTTPLT